jgi:hypothetical protein
MAVRDITEIAEALRLCTILEGSVQKAGSRIRVNAQLISAEDGSHLWSERYDRKWWGYSACRIRARRHLHCKAPWSGRLPGLAPLLEGGSDPFQVTSGLIAVHEKLPLEFVKLLIR